MWFTQVTVFPSYPNKAIIQWDLEHADESGAYLFWVERSGSPESNWESLHTVPLVNTYTFEDTSVRLLAKENFYFYRVRVTSPGGVSLTSEAKDLRRNLNHRFFLLANEIVRKEHLRLTRQVGVEAYLLKRKQWGALCSVCYDAISKECTNAHCEVCFGTRYTGGFFNPILTWIEILPSQGKKQLSSSGVGVEENFITSGKMLAYPSVTVRDVIVEKDNNRRWVVRQVTPAEIHTVPLTQELALSEISPSDVEYKIPV